MSQKSNVVPLVLNDGQARQILREVAGDSRRVFVSEHAEQQMAGRQITRTQVIRCLQHGRIVEGPVQSLGGGNWELAVECLSAGDVLRVAAAIDCDDDGNFVVVITAYYIR